jgi:hypothetical protein
VEQSKRSGTVAGTTDGSGSGPRNEVTPTSTGPVAYSQLVLQAAEQNPRLLIDEPGWTATTVYGFAEKEGTIAWSKGGLELEMNWYPASAYNGYYEDRKDVSAPEAVTVDGQAANRFTYTEHDWAVMLTPKGGTFVELRTGGNWTRAEFDRVVSHVVHADVQTWLAALPPEIVTPDKVSSAADKVLADIPLPPASTSPNWPPSAPTTRTSSAPA